MGGSKSSQNLHHNTNSTMPSLLLLTCIVSTLLQATNGQHNEICGVQKKCATCTPLDGCGWCVDVQSSGDKTTKKTTAICVGLNSTHPGSPPEGRRCNEGFHNSICPCPNQCSGHGVCSVKGKCDCFRAYSGEDCTTVKETKFNPAIVVPISIAFMGVLVGGIVFLHLRQSGEARHGDLGTTGSDASSNQEEDQPYERSIHLRSKFAKYTDSVVN